MFDEVPTAEELVHLRDAARQAAVVDVELLDDHALMGGALVLTEARAALEAAEGHVLAELERRDTCDREVGLSTAAWLADRAHGPANVVAGRIRVATKLRTTLPEVDAALAAGTITFDH